MRMKTAALALALIFIFTTAGLAQINYNSPNQAQGQAQGQLQGQAQLQAQGQAQGQVANAINAGNNQTSVNLVEQTIGMEVTNPRQLPIGPGTGQPLFPTFYDDPREMADWRVSPASELIAELGGDVDLVDIIRLSNGSVKIGDALLRETMIEPKRVTFTGMANTSMRLMGSVSGYSENDKLTTANCLASAVLYAAKKGATHFILVKDGYRRAGTFFGWHIGLGGGASGIMNDAGGTATGGAASIGPGVTSAESSRADRPFVTIKCYYIPTAAPK